MPHVNAPSPTPFSRHLSRRRLLLAGLAATLLPMPARAQDKKSKRNDPNSGQPLRPPVNSRLLQVDAVTMPVAGPPERLMIMTFTLECKSIEVAQEVEALHPRFYNAVIVELNREPVGANGRVTDKDLEMLKRRLLFQINRALKGPVVDAIYVRSMQEVPRRQ